MMMRMLLCAGLAAGALSAQNTLVTTGTERYFNVVRRNLEGSADAMPAEKYGYRLTPGQMTFAEWLNHSTQRNFTDCAAMRSEDPPEEAKGVPSLKEKAEVSKALKDSL